MVKEWQLWNPHPPKILKMKQKKVIPMAIFASGILALSNSVHISVLVSYSITMQSILLRKSASEATKCFYLSFYWSSVYTYVLIASFSVHLQLLNYSKDLITNFDWSN